MNESKNELEKPYIDYDGQWKRVIEVFFEPMTVLFMPELAADIDFSKPPEFLEQELAAIMSEQTAKGRMSVDKLLKIPMKNGEYEHIFLHVEVQSHRKIGFLKRNFKYFYRIFDSKGKAITAFVIYTHDDVPAPHDRYVYNFRGTELTYKFNTYLVRDAEEEALLQSDNIFALVILTCKYINRTKNNIELRRKFKFQLFRLALERNYPKEHIKALINFINILVYLPPEITQEFEKEVTQEFKQINMVEDKYIVLDREEALEFRAIQQKYDAVQSEIVAFQSEIATFQSEVAAFQSEVAAFQSEVAALESKVEEKERTLEDQRIAVEEQKSKVEEQKMAKMSIIYNLISSTDMQLNEIAKITGISIEEVLNIKAEMEGKD